MAKDMMGRMLEDMMGGMLEQLVDYMLMSSGQTKESIGAGINQFLQFGAYAHGALQRIEHNQRLLIEAENERRRADGLGPLAGLYNGSGPSGAIVTNGGDSGVGGGARAGNGGDC